MTNDAVIQAPAAPNMGPVAIENKCVVTLPVTKIMCEIAL